MTIRYLLVLLCACYCSATVAATITVDTFTDEFTRDGDCSLREAVWSANVNIPFDECAAGSAVGADTIEVYLFGTLSLSMGHLGISDSLQIIGLGKEFTRIDGNHDQQIFRVNMSDGLFTLSDMTLKRGYADGSDGENGGGGVQISGGSTFRFTDIRFDNNMSLGEGGGAISMDHALAADIENATVRIQRCHFTGNQSEGGGAISAVARQPFYGIPDEISIYESMFLGNTSTGAGGAVLTHDVSSLTITDSQFESNVAVGSGGAVSFFDGDLLTIAASAFINNTSNYSGGAVQMEGVLMNLWNSTFTLNDAFAAAGDAIAVLNHATANVHFATIVGNGRGQANDSAISVCTECNLNLASSVVWTESPNDVDCVFDFLANYTSLGHNVDGSHTCSTNQNDHRTTDPWLLPLGDYGGWGAFHPQSMPPRASSPLVDLSTGNSCADFTGLVDQRADLRPVDGDGDGFKFCDTGSVEYQPGSDPADFVLSISVGGTGGSGAVNILPEDIDCSTHCSRIYLEGTAVQLQAVAGPGSHFSGWTGDCTGMGTCHLSMDQNRQVTALFSTDQDVIFSNSFENELN